jgi:hypothetical protein
MNFLTVFSGGSKDGSKKRFYTHRTISCYSHNCRAHGDSHARAEKGQRCSETDKLR